MVFVLFLLMCHINDKQEVSFFKSSSFFFSQKFMFYASCLLQTSRDWNNIKLARLWNVLLWETDGSTFTAQFTFSVVTALFVEINSSLYIPPDDNICPRVALFSNQTTFSSLCDVKFTGCEKLMLSLREMLHYPHASASPATHEHVTHLRALVKLNVLSWQPITSSISRRTFSGSALCSPNVFSMRCWQTRGNQTGYYKAFFQYPFNWAGCETYWMTSDTHP